MDGERVKKAIRIAVVDERIDLDGDNDLDLVDHQIFLKCLNGPGHPPAQPACNAADTSGDGDVDLNDFTAIQAAFTGPS